MCNVSRLVLMCNRPPLSIVVAKKKKQNSTPREKIPFVCYFEMCLRRKGCSLQQLKSPFQVTKNRPLTDKTIFKHFTYFFFSFKISKRNTNFASLNLQHICYNGMLLSSNALLILRLKNVFNSWRLALNKNQEQNVAHDELFYLFFSCISVFLSFFVLTTISCLVLDIFFFFKFPLTIHLNVTIRSPIKNHFVCSISIFDFIFRFVSLFLFNYFHFTISIFNLFHFVFGKIHECKHVKLCVHAWRQ